MSNIEYPKTVSVEITNNCNNQCLICPHGHNLIKEKGYMTQELFYTILEKLDHIKEGAVLELHGVGEPLLHPQLYEFTERANKKGYNPSICTNAILLNKSAAKRLSDSGMKKVVVSLETKENYERIRCINIYDIVLENVMMVADNYPQIELEIYMISVDQEGEEEFENFVKQFKGKKISFNQFNATDWCGAIPFEGLTTKTGKLVRKCICPLFEHYCSIDYNGLIRHCYLDFNSEYIYGDLKISNFDDIWTSDLRKEILRKMEEGLFDSMQPCSRCVFPFTDSEESIMESSATTGDLERPEMQLLSKIKQSWRKN